jgi:toxin ParE1/3/4
LDFAPERNVLREDLAAGLRALQVQDYLVFYRVEEERVLILRVIHGARDITDDMFGQLA